MTEFVLVLMGIILALCACIGVMCWQFAKCARIALQDVRDESSRSLLALREAAMGIADEHNTLVKVQAEQAQTLERIGSELAARNLRR